MILPDYACAIISVDTDSYLLEQRDNTALYAAGMLTCFGGRRNADEEVIACLQRELHEELNWQAPDLELACALWVAERYVADFFHCRLNVPVSQLTFEAHRSGRIVHKSALADAEISPWHRAVFDAFHAQEQEVRLAQ